MSPGKCLDYKSIYLMSVKLYYDFTLSPQMFSMDEDRFHHNMYFVLSAFLFF